MFWNARRRDMMICTSGKNERNLCLFYHPNAVNKVDKIYDSFIKSSWIVEAWKVASGISFVINVENRKVFHATKSQSENMEVGGRVCV